MKILGVIPARGGSKGVPRKNIKLLGGKPLIAYTIKEALKSKLTRVIVSTEDKEIADIAKTYGADIPFMRPAALALDGSSTIEVVLHIIDELSKKNEFYDAICILQPTTPFRTASDIETCIMKFITSKSDSLISVREVPTHFNPHWVFVEDENNLLKIATGEREIIKNRQELPKAYCRDGTIYLTWTKVIIEQKSLYGSRVSYWINPNKNYVNIDALSDWYKAERLMIESEKKCS